MDTLRLRRYELCVNDYCASCDDGLQSAGNLAKVLRKTNFQGSEDPAECAFSSAFGSKLFLISEYLNCQVPRQLYICQFANQLMFSAQKGLFDYFYNEDVI